MVPNDKNDKPQWYFLGMVGELEDKCAWAHEGGDRSEERRVGKEC